MEQGVPERAPVEPPAAIQLSLAQQTAIEATQGEIVRLRNKLRLLMAEAGLNPDVQHAITPDGRAVPG